MTDIFVDSNASGADDGTSFTDAFGSILDVAPSSGDRILIADNHSESFGTNNVPMPPTYTPTDPNQPVAVLSVDTSDNSLSPGASITQTQPSRLTDGYSWFGVDFSGGSFDQWQNSTGSAGEMVMRQCTFTKTGGGSMFTAAGPFHWEFHDCTFTANGTGGWWDLDREGTIILRNCTIDGSAAQNIFLLNSDNLDFLHLDFENCDFSGASSATDDFINISDDANVRGRIFNCRLPSGMDFFDRSLTDKGRLLDMLAIFTRASSSTDPAIDFQHHQSMGLVEEDTARTRTGGASDGTTGYSWRMTLDSTATPIPQVHGIVSPPISIYVEGGSSTTVTVHVAHDGVGDGTSGDLLDSELWLQGMTPDTAATAFPAGGAFDTLPSGAPADLSNNSETWGGTGVGTTQEVAHTVTPTEDGYWTFRVHFTPVDQTGVAVNICPKPEVS